MASVSGEMIGKGWKEKGREEVWVVKRGEMGKVWKRRRERGEGCKGRGGE